MRVAAQLTVVRTTHTYSSAVDLIHGDVSASCICTIRYKLMQQCAVFDLASARTSTYLSIR